MVIAIIGVLVALLLPAVQAARESARRTHCQSNMKNISLATLDYAAAHDDDLPVGGITNGPCCSTRSNENWAILILPYLEQHALHDQYDFDAYNEARVNWPVLQTIVPIFLCPSDEDTLRLERPSSGPGDHIPMARGSYRGNTGRCASPFRGWWDSPSQTTGFFPDFQHWKGPLHAVGVPTRGREYPGVGFGPNLKDVTDGMSNTLLIGEGTSKTTTSADRKLIEATNRRRTFWAYTYTSYNKSCVVPQTRTMLFDYGRCVEVGGETGSNACKRAWGSLHPGGLYFSYGDGSVRFLETAIDTEIFAQRATMAGGEITR